jgi:hypothetical protein
MIDLVAGDRPVPTALWRTPAGDHPAPISRRLAYRLIAAYTEPGDTVVDLTDISTVADATVTGARIHVRAAFADGRLVVTGTGANPVDPPARRRRWSAGPGVEPPALADWFGDDLRDADRPAGTTPDDTTAAPHRLDVDRPALLVARWPLDGDADTDPGRLGVLVALAAAVLRPGGCLAFVATNAVGTGDYTAVVGAARAAGLRYLQHIVAIDADVDGDHLVYYATDRDLVDLDAVTHTRVHADLIVLTAPGGGVRG